MFISYEKSSRDNLEDFMEDEDLKRAFVRSLEVIGEAVKKIPEDIRSKYPQIPWKEMAGMRNKLIHEYFGVSYILVWNTVSSDIPVLKNAISKILEELKGEEL